MLGPIFCLCFSLFGGNNQRNVFEQVARGNWTVDVMNTKTEEKLNYYLRISDNHAGLYENNESQEELQSFNFAYDGQFTVNVESPEGNIAVVSKNLLRQHITGVTKYQQYTVNFVVQSPTVIHMDVFDTEKNEFYVVTLLCDRPPLTFMQKYGRMIFMGIIFFGTQIFSFKNQKKMMEAQRAAAQKQAQEKKKKEEEAKKENTPKVEEVEEVKENEEKKSEEEEEKKETE